MLWRLLGPDYVPPGAWGCISLRRGSSSQNSRSLGTLEQSVFSRRICNIWCELTQITHPQITFFQRDQVEGKENIGQTIDKVMWSLWGSQSHMGDGMPTSWSSKLSNFLITLTGRWKHQLKLQSVKQIVIDAGLEPSDLRQMKPVLVNTENFGNKLASIKVVWWFVS